VFEEVGAGDDELDGAVPESMGLEVEEGLAGGLAALVEAGCDAVLHSWGRTTEGESCSAR
jgi:hypothetical protein